MRPLFLWSLNKARWLMLIGTVDDLSTIQSSDFLLEEGSVSIAFGRFQIAYVILMNCWLWVLWVQYESIILITLMKRFIEHRILLLTIFTFTAKLKEISNFTLPNRSRSTKKHMESFSFDSFRILFFLSGTRNTLRFLYLLNNYPQIWVFMQVRTFNIKEKSTSCSKPMWSWLINDRMLTKLKMLISLCFKKGIFS